LGRSYPNHFLKSTSVCPQWSCLWTKNTGSSELPSFSCFSQLPPFSCFTGRITKDLCSGVQRIRIQTHRCFVPKIRLAWMPCHLREGSDLVIEHLPSACDVLGLIPSTSPSPPHTPPPKKKRSSIIALQMVCWSHSNSHLVLMNWIQMRYPQKDLKEPDACNPSYSGGRDQEDRGSKSAHK
jgi:hypothetical protein